MKSKRHANKHVSKFKEADDFATARRMLLAVGNNSSELGRKFLILLRKLRPPGSCTDLTKLNIDGGFTAGSIFDSKQDILVENECARRNCSLLGLCSHSKKRPNTVVLARLYDGHLLDAFELAIDNFTLNKNISIPLSIKPFIITEGSLFSEYSKAPLRSFFIQFFQGGVPLEKYNLFNHSQWALVLRSAGDDENILQIRAFCCDENGPLLNEDCAFKIDIKIGRVKRASELLYKRATSKPLAIPTATNKAIRERFLRHKKAVKTIEKKNIKVDGLGSKVARIHIGKQHLDKLQGRRVKALRSSKCKAK
ncbi:hypothetical protein GJ496_000116 [Pomphorhynchus laevis]|nr:hypothetical protein GJ496_000116 [Pomphorhynchus laevis]